MLSHWNSSSPILFLPKQRDQIFPVTMWNSELPLQRQDGGGREFHILTKWCHKHLMTSAHTYDQGLTSHSHYDKLSARLLSFILKKRVTKWSAHSHLEPHTLHFANNSFPFWQHPYQKLIVQIYCQQELNLKSLMTHGGKNWNFYLGMILFQYWVVFFQSDFHCVWSRILGTLPAPTSVVPVIYPSPEVIISVSDATICCYGNYYVVSKDQRIMGSWRA